jgi:hypothetical protein
MRRGAACTVSDDQKPEDQKKSWIARLGGKWVQALIATLIGLSITVPLAYFWGEGTNMVKTWYAERQNMSYDEAIALAKETVGASTIDVIPFRNADSGDQYIAVIRTSTGSKPPPTDYTSTMNKNPSYTELAPFCPTEIPGHHQCYEVTVLQGTEGLSPEVFDTGMEVYDGKFDDAYNLQTSERYTTPEQEYIDSLFGVEDFDEDGNKELYSIHRHGGSASYTVTVRVYDTLERETYELKGSGPYMQRTLDTRFTGSTPPKAELSNWMKQKLDEKNFAAETAAQEINEDQENEWEQMPQQERYVTEAQTWLRSHGKGFYKGKLAIEEFKGEIPYSEDPSCYIDEGELQWATYFKGPLFGYNKSKDTHFIVFIPEGEIGWVRTMVSGKQYLWLGLSRDDGVLAFNKEAQTLEVIPATIPESRIMPGPYGTLNGVFSVHDSSLYLSDFLSDLGQGRLEDVPIALPEYINSEEEFGAAIRCTRHVRTPSGTAVWVK